MSLSSVLLPAPLGATRPVRPEPTVKDRSWNTGVSSGQVKDRLEQTTQASDMEVTSRGSGQEKTLPPGGRQRKGTTAKPNRHTSRRPVRSGYHPETSSSTTMSGLLNEL